MAQDIRTISILDTTTISTKEIISYLEKINSANASIADVLRRKPALPGYKKLPWFINFHMDIEITDKLRQKRSLSADEIKRLTVTLTEALKELRKVKRSKVAHSVISLEKYIASLN